MKQVTAFAAALSIVAGIVLGLSAVTGCSGPSQELVLRYDRPAEFFEEGTVGQARFRRNAETDTPPLSGREAEPSGARFF